jgi:long-chain acyl-CoA synthetase
LNFSSQLKQHQGTALISPDNEVITYPHLLKVANTINQQLDGDTRKKKLIFIKSGQNIATIYSIVAILTGKHAAMLLPENIDDDKLSRLIKAYQPNFILETISNKWMLKKISSKAILLHKKLCILLSTSGSTGSPKQVKLSTDNLFENAKSIISYLNITAKERAISSLPLSYSYGLSILTTHLLAGASILVSNSSIMTRDFWHQLEKFKITSLAGVPYTYSMLKRLKLDQKDLPYLKTLTQAGGKLSQDLIQFFANYAVEKEKRFFVMYGQTEATARMSYMDSNDISNYPQSIGIAIPKGQFFLEDDNGDTITSNNQSGELVYKGPNIMMGYAIDKDDLSLDSQLSELKTGDLAYTDKAGRYYISGRKSRFIKLFGLRVNLDEVEKNLAKENYSVVCTGYDDFLLIVAEEKYDSDTLLKCVQNHLSLNPQVIHINVACNIPHNENGKINYQQLLNKYSGNTINE